MVIQRDKPIRMWGSAEPEATVQVRLAELNDITKAAAGRAGRPARREGQKVQNGENPPF